VSEIMSREDQRAVRIFVQGEPDAAEATRRARCFALEMGFDKVQSSYIATAAAELASNLWIHGGGGSLVVKANTEKREIEIVAADNGPGIADIGLALQDGYSTGGGLGCGLPGVKRLMDGLEIESRVGEGTRIRATKSCHGFP
jgi:serine/threonine-protein kinase RsbT